MLAYVLALVIGLGSLGMYIAAFFFPEVHRKEDFIWSGVGLFYALVLWVCAGRITGGDLLGQMASVALLGWFGWQTLTLRRAIASPEQQTEIPSQSELQSKLKNLSPVGSLQGLQERVTGLFSKGKSEAQTPQPPTAATVSSPAVTIIDTTKQAEPAPEEVKEANASAAPSFADATDASSLDNASADDTATAEASTDTVLDVTDTITAPETTEEEPAAGDTEMSESPVLIRPNPPDPELVKAAIESTPEDAPESSQATVPIEEIAPEVELAPPAEPPGPGDPQDRQAEPDVSIEAVPVDPENPPKQT